MRAVVQRVSQAKVTVAGQTVGEISTGLVSLLGIARDDEHSDADYLADKLLHLRIFSDEQGKMNLSLFDISGEMLVISQFTLYGDARKGRRPSYIEAAEPEKAYALYDYLVEQVRNSGIKTATGVFQAMMQVSLVNDGPVTILLDSRKKF